MDKFTDEGHSSKKGGCRQRNRVIFRTIQAHSSPPVRLPPLFYPSPSVQPHRLCSSLHYSTAEPLPEQFRSLEILLLLHTLNLLYFSKACSNPTPTRKNFLTNLHHPNVLLFQLSHVFLPGIGQVSFGCKWQKSSSQWLIEKKKKISYWLLVPSSGHWFYGWIQVILWYH